MPGFEPLGDISFGQYVLLPVRLVPIYPAGSYSALVVADGAWNYWKLDEKTGTVAVDAIGGKDGTISGGVALGQTSPLSPAMLFDGVTGKITTPSIALPLTCSIEAWIKTTGSTSTLGTTGQQNFFSNRYNNATDGFFIGCYPGGALYVYANAGTPAAVTGGPSLYDGLWHHVVITTNGSVTRGYIDGRLVFTAAQTRTVSAAGTGEIGTDTTVYNINPAQYPPWNGLIDEVAIYPVVLSSGQILNHFNAVPRKIRPKVEVQLYGGYRGVVLNTPGLQNYYRLNDTEGYDQAIVASAGSRYWQLSGNANDIVGSTTGTITGTVTWGQTGPIPNGLTAAFIGTDGYIDNGAYLTFGTSWTVALWIKKTNDGAQHIVFSTFPSGGGANLIQIGTQVADRLYAYSEATSLYIYQGTDIIIDGNWHFVVMTFDGTNIKTYLDGVLKATSAQIYNWNSCSMNIGRYGRGGYNWNGYVSRVFVAPYPLTADHIAYLYSLRNSSIPLQSWTSVVDRITGKTGTKNRGVSLQQPSLLGDFSTSAKFDGGNVGSGINVIGKTSTLGTTWSMDFWMVWAGGQQGTIICDWATNNGLYIVDGPNWGGTAGNFRLVVTWDGGITWKSSNVNLVANQLYHVAVVVSAGNGTFYLNGVASGTFNGWPSGVALGVIGYNTFATAFKGTLDEIALYNTALTTNDLANRMAAKNWTDITPDLVDEVSWDRGLQDTQPNDLVAKTGQLSFSLRNDQRNSALTRKWYSPNASIARPGFTFGIPVRVSINDGFTDHPRWIGKIHNIQPESGKWSARRTKCTALDTINDLAEFDVHTIQPQLSKTEVQLLAAVHGELSEDAKPVGGTFFDIALDTYPYAFDDVSSGVRALYAINQVITSARGLYYQDRKGTHIYVNRQTLQAKQVSAVFTDSHGVVVPSSLDNVYNRIRVIQHIRTVNTAAIITLYAASGRMSVAAGATVEVFGDYSDPATRDRLIGGTNFQTPLVAGTDYSANAAQNGSGTDYTSSVVVVAYAFAASVKFTITNNYTAPVWVQYQLRGSGVYDNAPISYDSFTPMPYGDRLLEVDLMYQADQNVAQSLASLIKTQTINLEDQVETMDLMPQIDKTWVAYTIDAEISDVLTVSDDQTGLEAASTFVYAIRESFDAEGIYHVQYLLAPRGQGAVTFIFDDAVHGLFDSPVSLLGFG